MTRRTLALLLPLVVSGCVSVRTVDVAPTPEAVAGFVAVTLGDSPAGQLSSIPGDSVLAVWYASDPRRLTSAVHRRAGRAFVDLDRVETFVVGGRLVDVFVYPSDGQARRAANGIQEAFGFTPLDQVDPTLRGDYYVSGPLVVRVLTPALDETVSFDLDNGLGRPWFSGYSSSFATYRNRLSRHGLYSYDRAQAEAAIAEVAAIMQARERANAEPSSSSTSL